MSDSKVFLLGQKVEGLQKTERMNYRMVGNIQPEEWQTITLYQNEDVGNNGQNQRAAHIFVQCSLRVNAGTMKDGDDAKYAQEEPHNY